VSLNVPKPSKRFVRAAHSEREDLLGHRQRLEVERDRHLDDVRRLDDALAGLDERLRILNQMLGDPVEAEEQHDAERRAAEDASGFEQRDVVEDRSLLSGPAIREVAVQVLLRQSEYIEALHYRRWYGLLREAGYAVAGKDPSAVFLTQLTRSPVIRKSTEAGVYELDRQAPLRLRQRLERLQAELKELRSPASIEQGESENVRARRHELNVAISQTERALDEALRVLRRDQAQAQPDAASPVASRH
jgi:chromosome segregation ATPase